ncbi:MAG: LysM domain-containing protein, partial [Bacteroidota bacterium]
FREQIDVFPGDVPRGVEPNTFVETNFFFADFQLNYFLLSKKPFSPFVAAGVGMLSFSPEDQDGNFLGENIFTRLEGETYNTTILSIPLSVGFQYEVNQVIALSLGYTHRLTPTDYLDNIGLLGTKEGNDALQHFQVGVHFSLVPGDQIKRPPPPQDPERPLDIVAFPPEEDRQAVFRVPDQLTADIPPNRTANNRREQLIETDLARVLRENRDLNEQGDSYLTDWQRQEQEAIAAKQFIYYAVKPTDQLGDIARRFRTTPQMIRQLNQLPAEGLGEQVYLRIPDVNQATDTMTVEPPVQLTDSLSDDPDWLALEEEALLEERFRFIFVSKEQSLAELAQ